MKWSVTPMSKSLFREMKDSNHPSLKIGEKSKLGVESSLLKDIKDGKNPEKKHVTLDKFFTPS